MAAQLKEQNVTEITDFVRRRIVKRVNLAAGGNSKRRLRDIAVDLINESKLDFDVIAEGCFLHPSTIKALANDERQFPQAETIERIFKYFSMETSLREVDIKPTYANRPKE